MRFCLRIDRCRCRTLQLIVALYECVTSLSRLWLGRRYLRGDFRRISTYVESLVTQLQAKCRSRCAWNCCPCGIIEGSQVLVNRSRGNPKFMLLSLPIVTLENDPRIFPISVVDSLRDPILRAIPLLKPEALMQQLLGNLPASRSRKCQVQLDTIRSPKLSRAFQNVMTSGASGQECKEGSLEAVTRE
jgi:hypothetical protein